MSGDLSDVFGDDDPDPDHEEPTLIYDAVVIERCNGCGERTVGGVISTDLNTRIVCMECDEWHPYADVCDVRTNHPDYPVTDDVYPQE